MPNDNDSLDQLPSPPSSNAPNTQDEDSAPSLTDPVAPDISSPSLQKDLPEPESEPETEPELETESELEPEPETTSFPSSPEPEPTPLQPATVPPVKSKTGFKFGPIILIIAILFSLVAAGFLYLQNQTLTSQLADLKDTIESQPLPTASPTEELTPTPTPDSNSTASATPTPTITQQVDVFPRLEAVFAMAKNKYSDAQLLLITSENPQLVDTSITKYWFRKTESSKTYFYIIDQDTQLSLVDQQVYISPDNNIPSLNSLYQEGKLGLDLNRALELTNALCTDRDACLQASSIKAQFIKTTQTIWQITYTVSGKTNPLVVQFNSQTGDVLFKSDNF